MKTNAMRLLETLGVHYEIRDIRQPLFESGEGIMVPSTTE